MGKKPKTRKTRAAAKQRKHETELRKQGNGGKQLAAKSLSKPASEFGVLRRLFNLARGSKLTPPERKALVLDIEKLIAESGTNLRPKDFNVKNAMELAEVIVKEFEEMEISSKTFRAFAAQKRIKGYQGSILGKLFHMYGSNFEPLQKDFHEAAKAQVNELNDPRISGTFSSKSKPELPPLVNAKGHKMSLLKNFGAPRKAKNIRIILKNGQNPEFIDEALVSTTGKGQEGLWSFLEEIEYKGSGAAGGFAEQIGSAQLRFMADEVEAIEMVVEGFDKPVRIKPENIVFSQRSIDRNAVTLLSNSQWGRIKSEEVFDLTEAIKSGDKDKIYGASYFRYQWTSKGSGETFRRITFAVDTSEFNKLVRAVLPVVSRKLVSRK